MIASPRRALQSRRARSTPGRSRIEGHGQDPRCRASRTCTCICSAASTASGLTCCGYQKYLNALLYAGVTTVMDTGNVRAVRAAAPSGSRPPGECWGRASTAWVRIVDGADPVWPALSVAIASKDQVPRIVASTRRRTKVDFIKLYVGLSDHAGTHDLCRGGPARHAHHHRSVVAQRLRRSSRQEGIAGFAHFPSHRISDETIATIKAHNVFLISTLAVQESASVGGSLDLVLSRQSPDRRHDAAARRSRGLRQGVWRPHAPSSSRQRAATP